MVLNPKDKFAESKPYIHTLCVWTLYGMIDVLKGCFSSIEAAGFTIGEKLPARWIGETPTELYSQRRSESQTQAYESRPLNNLESPSSVRQCLSSILEAQCFDDLEFSPDI